MGRNKTAQRQKRVPIRRKFMAWINGKPTASTYAGNVKKFNNKRFRQGLEKATPGFIWRRGDGPLVVKSILNKWKKKEMFEGSYHTRRLQIPRSKKSKKKSLNNRQAMGRTLF